ncbi:MAG: LacI family DNA-binding transcriptional regulator [Lachnospiraceae bacterium]|nr:LacI family DNA-binding transcriptional regulator [Lachnospiraceae bacterium]
MVSMKDIAQRCGVSVATVSKAINGQQDIGEATRKRILSEAKKMGYTPNAAARSLKTRRTNNLGILFMDLQYSGFMHEYFASMLNYFRMEAEQRGYDICFINNNIGHPYRSYLQHVRFRGVDGVAIICADFKDPLVQELVYSGLPVVTLDHAFHNRTAVLSDNTDGMLSLVRYVYGKGHRKLGYIHGNDTAVTENRLTAFYRACDELGIAVPDDYIGECEYHEPESCYKATKKMLALKERPDCIFFSDDYAYIGGERAIREAGLRIPDDISVVGYDGIHMAKIVSPRLTTWEQNTGELGKIAADRLIERIEKPKTALPEHIVVHGHLLEGETVRTIVRTEG